MSNKQDRQDAILELIASVPIASQEELRQRMSAQGWRVTQATLSRDLRDLGVVRAPTGDGSRYVLPEHLAVDDKPKLDNILPQLFDSVDGVGELLVVKTLSSGAQPVSEAIDGQDWPEVIGTLAGENTILIICRSADARAVLADRIRRLAGVG